MRVSELCNLTKEDIDWQTETIKVFGKKGPYGTDKPYRVSPMSDKVKLMLDKYFAIYDDFKDTGTRAIQAMLKKIANRTTTIFPTIL